MERVKVIKSCHLPTNPFRVMQSVAVIFLLMDRLHAGPFCKGAVWTLVGILLAAAAVSMCFQDRREPKWEP